MKTLDPKDILHFLEEEGLRINATTGGQQLSPVSNSQIRAQSPDSYELMFQGGSVHVSTNHSFLGAILLASKQNQMVLFA